MEKEKTKIFDERIDKKKLELMPLIVFRGNIHLINNLKEMESAIKILSNENLLGFDTETRPSFKKGESNKVSLLQLSCDSEAFLFRLNKIGFPMQLKELIKNPSIKKIGLAVHDDIKALSDINSFEPKGFVDLAIIARKLGIITTGLRNLSGIILGSKISKKSQLSNWENKELDYNQKLYAATDAWVCREIYCRLIESGIINIH